MWRNKKGPMLFNSSNVIWISNFLKTYLYQLHIFYFFKTFFKWDLFFVGNVWKKLPALFILIIQCIWNHKLLIVQSLNHAFTMIVFLQILFWSRFLQNLTQPFYFLSILPAASLHFACLIFPWFRYWFTCNTLASNIFTEALYYCFIFVIR